MECDVDHSLHVFQTRLNLAGAKPREAAEFLFILCSTIAERVGFPLPQLYGSYELDESLPGYTIVWNNAWEEWATSLVSKDGVILPGFRPLRSPLVFTEESAATSPHVQLVETIDDVATFAVTALSGNAISFRPLHLTP